MAQQFNAGCFRDIMLHPEGEALYSLPAAHFSFRASNIRNHMGKHTFDVTKFPGMVMFPRFLLTVAAFTFLIGQGCSHSSNPPGWSDEDVKEFEDYQKTAEIQIEVVRDFVRANQNGDISSAHPESREHEVFDVLVGEDVTSFPRLFGAALGPLSEPSAFHRELLGPSAGDVIQSQINKDPTVEFYIIETNIAETKDGFSHQLLIVVKDNKVQQYRLFPYFLF